ncbi:MAG TPA: hypothetical protein VFV62_07450 [Gaiellaceae bacterium]|nr:hypothetical protein [Gaiellaceae bacterium]
MFWAALTIALFLTVSSLIYATWKGLEAFRAFKQLARRAGEELDRIATATGEIERHLARATAGGAEVEASLARLSASRAQLNVLTSALADVRAAVGRVTAFVPQK